MCENRMKLRLWHCTSAPDEILAGEVSLHFPAVLKDKTQEVYIKLRGFLTVSMAYNSRDSSLKTRTEQKLDLTQDKIIVWRPGQYPPPESHTLDIPFEFRLSKQLPYTCKYSVNHPDCKITTEVSYYLELVGVRPALRSKRRQRVDFRVIPSLTRGGEIQEQLATAWLEEWRTVSRERRIPVHNTGGYSHVQFSFTRPAMEAIPSSTSIPFSLTIVTTSPPVYEDETQKESWPSPPSSPSEVSLTLERLFRIAHNGREAIIDVAKCISHLGGMGPSQFVTRNGGPVRMERMEKVWIPSTADPRRGTWREETKFISTFRCICPATLITELLKVEYRMRIKVKFAGYTEGLECEVPITIIGGPPSPTLPVSPSLSYERLLQAQAALFGPQHTEELPGYFDLVVDTLKPSDHAQSVEDYQQGSLTGSVTRKGRLPTAFPDSDIELHNKYRASILGP